VFRASPLPPGERGDPGLYGPGSTVWRVGRERVLLAGGPAALLLQIAHPMVAAAVADHGDFRQDPLARLRGTVDTVLAISFGDRRQAEAAARTVRTRHRAVSGTVDGKPYRATDPELGAWVHATLVHASLESFALLVGPLTDAERDRYYQEAKAFAALFGVTERHLPSDYPAFRAYFDERVAELAVGDDARSLAPNILAPPLPLPASLLLPAQRLMTAGLLPASVRSAFGLGWMARDKASFQAVSAGVRTGIKAVPPRLRYWPHDGRALERLRLPGSGRKHGT